MHTALLFLSFVLWTAFPPTALPSSTRSSSDLKQRVTDETVSYLRHHARLAKLADCLVDSEDGFTRIQNKEGVQVLRIIHDSKRTDGIAGYVGILNQYSNYTGYNNKPLLTIGFSSTRGVKDWLLDINLLNRKPFVDRQLEFCAGIESNWSLIPSDARIHKGFYEAFEGVVDLLTDVFRNYNLLKGCDDESRVNLSIGGVRFVG